MPLTLTPEKAALARAFAADLRPGRRVCITTHVNPDGDGLGSEVGLVHLLRAQALALREMPIDVRYDGEPGWVRPGNRRAEPRQRVWMRIDGTLPDDPLLHEALFAYVSDYGLLWTSLQPHDVRMGDPRLQIASLDHTIWFHRPFRADQWLLYAQSAPVAHGGRGLAFGHYFDQAGTLVASMAQEMLLVPVAARP